MITAAYKLLIDTREKAVSQHKDAFQTVHTEIAQITVGDYAILDHHDQVVAIFERKTYDDYGASLKDGRHENRAKLLSLRQKTGCRVFYIVEGKCTPCGVYGGIPIDHIKSSIVHLQLRDGISMIYTADTYDTACTLRHFVACCATMKGEFAVGGSQVAQEVPIEPQEAIVAHRTLLFEVHAKDDASTLRTMWAKFRGITVANAGDFARKWTLHEAMSGVNADLINDDADKPKIKVTKMQRESLKQPTVKTIEAIFAEFPGISKATAPHYATLFAANKEAFIDAAILRECKLMQPAQTVAKPRPAKKVGKKADLVVRLLNLRLQA